MDYKFWKLLKDAGFPQKFDGQQGYWYTKGSNVSQIDIDMGKNVHIKTEDVYVPTLEELVEHCGSGFTTLTLLKNGMWACPDQNLAPMEAPTAKMAVAKLWLMLLGKLN